MNLDWIKELPSKETPLTKDFFKKLSTSILEYAFPIGKTEMFFDNEDHSNYMGFTWERTSEGCVPVGINENDTDFNTIGKIGGEKTHKLVINEIPSHNHGVYGALSGETKPIDNQGNDWAVGTTQAWVTPTSSSGGNQEHNNLQPYQVFAIWKRIA